jgi:hypothetical protein
MALHLKFHKTTLSASLIIWGLLLATAEGSHRRLAYGSAAAPHHGRFCQYGQPYPVYTMQSASPQVQSAGIPPALVPILFNVGQDLGTVALQQFIERLRSQGLLGPQGGNLPTVSPPTTLQPNSDLQSIQNRLDVLEKNLKITAPVQPGNSRKGPVDLPSGQPPVFPSFQ